MSNNHIVSDEKVIRTPLQFIFFVFTLILLVALSEIRSHSVGNLDALFLSIGLLVLTDLLAGRFTSGLWTGYILFSASMGWAIDGISGATVTIMSGFAISAILRLTITRWTQVEPKTPARVIDLFCARFASIGIAIIAIDTVYVTLGGIVPIITFEANLIFAILLAFTIGIISVQVVGLVLLNNDYRQQVMDRLFWRSGNPLQIILEYILLLLVPSIVVVYFNFSALLYLIAVIAIASQAVRYKQSANVRKSLEHHVDELIMLDTFSREIVSDITIDSLLRKIYEYIDQITGVTTLTIAIYDEGTKLISFPLIVHEGTELEKPDQTIVDNAIIGELKERFQPLEIGINQPESRLKGLQWHDSENIFIGYPLHVGNKFIGALCLSPKSNNGFGGDEKRIILTISTQVSLVLRNAILFDRSVSTSQKLARIYQFVQEVILNNDREDILLRSAEIIKTLFDAEAIAFFRRDVDTGNFVLIHNYQLNPTKIDILSRWLNSDHDYNVSIFTRTNLTEATDEPHLALIAEETGYQTITEIMLQSSSVNEGLIAVLHNQVRHYNVSELDILKTLALQISAALDNADLLHALESYASEQAQLVLFSRTLTASLDIDVVIEDIQQALFSMLDLETVAIGVVSKAPETIQFYNFKAKRADVELQLLNNNIEFNDTSPVIIQLKNADEDVKNILNILGTKQEVLIAPLIANHVMIGLIIVSSSEAFTPSNVRFLELASNHAATHLHTVQQYNYIEYALEKRLQQLAMIEDIAKNISATLDVTELIEHVLEAAIQSTQADVAVIALITDNQQMVVHGRYFDDDTWKNLDFVQSINEGTMGHVAQTGEPVLLHQNANSAEYLSMVENKNYLSSLVVPMMKDNDIHGVINLESTKENFFNNDHLEFISSLSDHAVISLQNTRLLNERQQQINTLTQLRKLSLVSIGADSQEIVMDAVLDTALEIIPADYASIATVDETPSEALEIRIKAKNDQSVNQLDAHVPDSVFETVIQQGKVFYITDVHKSPLYENFWNLKDIVYKSLIAIPLNGQHDTVKQVMYLLFAQIQPNLETFANTIELLSIQASGFLQNANLYEQIVSGNNRMAAILDATSNGIILLDRNGRLLQHNPSAERILDMSLYEYIGENFMDVILYRLQEVTTDVSEEAREGLRKMARVLRLEPERITRQQYALPHRDGTQIYVEEIGSPVMSSSYEIIGRLLVIRDMTEQKQIESFREEVTHMIIHDLRSPLGTILGSIAISLDIIKDPKGEPVEDAVIPALDVSVTTTERLLRLVDTILDISKLESRSMPLNLRPINIADVIEASSKSIKRTMEESNIQLSINIPEELPLVIADADKIERVIINLLDNAMRYTPLNGEVMLETESIQQGKYVLVRIADSGPGIPPDQQEKIFTKYNQIKGSMPQRGSKGSGLGLTFCKLTVEAHGGTIKVEPSGPLSGASFVFTLPAQ